MYNKKKTVLFICTYNSCRSQIAEGILKHTLNTYYDSFSAGIKKTQVHPLAIKVMREIGIDISEYKSKTIDYFNEDVFDIVVTVCDNAKETCPFFPKKHVIHKSFQDPSLIKGSEEKKLQAFRNTRNEIHQWILETFTPI